MAERKCKKDEAKKSLKYQKLDDNCKCIENICLYHIKDTFELKSYIDRLFNDESIKNAITLSTVHKAKGLEANRVIILLPNKLPMEYPNQKNWQLEQEKNLKYVAVTRAKKELIFIDMTENELLSANIA
jgi:superfamily I DNA/RNA helicase